MAILNFIAGDLNDFIWGWFGIALLFGTGIVMTVLTKFFQITHGRHWLKKTIGSLFNKKVSAHTEDKASISQFQALCTALAATVGTGNIAGVAGAIATGGAGAVFWMWLSAFFGMMTNYSENVLGIFYRRKNSKGEWAGGAMYYLQDGLGGKKGCKVIGRVLAVLFSLFAVLASFGIGNLAQANTISGNMEAAFGLPRWVTGLFLTVLAALVIIGGIKRIAAVAEKIVPFMAVAYIIGALVIIFKNVTSVGPVFGAIFKYAFTPSAAIGGAVGITIKSAIKMGFKRGIFSNEAGLGSSVMVHSASNVKEPVQQGLWGIFEVFFDTIIICTLTALVVLTSGVIDLKTGLLASATADGNTMVASAFSAVFGSFGGMFVALAILFFAFSTTLGWSYYGTRSWSYLFGEKSAVAYKVVFVGIIFVSAVLRNVDLPWNISDTFNGLMMVPNLIGVLALSPLVIKITNNYISRRLKQHKDVKPMLSHFEDIQAEAEKDLEA